MIKLLLANLQQSDRELFAMKRDATREHNSGMHDPSRLAAKHEKGLFLRREVQKKNKRLELLIS